jgi:hypothetical protein
LSTLRPIGDLSSEKLVKQAKGKVRRKCLFTLRHGDSLFHFAFLLCPILLFASFCERSALWLRLRRATLTIEVAIEACKPWFHELKGETTVRLC